MKSSCSTVPVSVPSEKTFEKMIHRFVQRFVSWVLLPVLVLNSAVTFATEGVPRVDYLIVNGRVYTGEPSPPQTLDIAIFGDRIRVLNTAERPAKAIQIIDATGMIVVPGFIDPHTHSMAELMNPATSANLNYLHQGVTTVFEGNDGMGDPAISTVLKRLSANRPGTNVALVAGHGAIRRAVLGLENRPPNPSELEQMSLLMRSAMEQGALGLSTGLYYVPGSYAETAEVVSLAKIAANYGGVYDSHIRDESSYSLGLLAAISEALDVGRKAGIPVHIAHIKALGTDVWGQSEAVIQLIENAREEGVSVTADQYPWNASGTQLRNALLGGWIKEGSEQAFIARLKDPTLAEIIRAEIAENMRRRGGAGALLIMYNTDKTLVGLRLNEIAERWQMGAIDAAIRILLSGPTGVTSFNMLEADIKNFMRQPWVMTCSDGSDGHPRKYASYPRKYQKYVVEHETLSLSEYVYRSSALVADTFGISQRGYLRTGYFADIAIIAPNRFRPRADYQNWNRLAEGVQYLFVNGQLTIRDEQFTGVRSGRALAKR